MKGGHFSMSDISDETVIYSCKPKLSAFLPFAAAGLAAIVLCAALGVWQIGAVLCGILIIYRAAAVNSNGITVTNLRVHSGKISVPLEKITGAVCGQSIAGKLFGYGTVTVRTSQSHLIFRGLPETDIICSEISKQVDLYHFRQTCRQAEQAMKMME